MNKIKINTVQNVEIEYNVASVGERILAFIIDGFVIAFYCIAVGMLIATFNINETENIFILLMLIFIFLPFFFYHLLMEVFFNGQSIGKMAMKIKVIRLDGESPSIGNYLLRWLLRLVDIAISQGGIAVLTILLSEKGQRLGDIAAGTTVVKLKQVTTLQDTMYAKLEETKNETEQDAYQVMYPQVSSLSDEDIAKIREIANTANRTDNLEALGKLFEKLKKVLEVAPKSTSTEFIKQIVKDYNYLNNGK